MTCSSRSTLAVSPDAIRRPKSSTAVVSQHADTRLMSWSTRITRPPVSAGIRRTSSPRWAGLLVGEAGRGLVEQDEPGVADDRPGHLDEATLAGAESADESVGFGLEADEAHRPHHILAAVRPAATRVLVHEQHVLVHREVGDGLLGLERPAQAPPRPLEVGDREEVVAERDDPSGERPDEPAEDVEERRLAGAVGADQAARAAGERDRHPIDRDDAAEADRSGR